MVEKIQIIEILEALAHAVRLDAYQFLIQAGPTGLSAGTLTAKLDIAPNALSFHLTRLRHAGLIQSRREGKQVIYSAEFSQMEALISFLSVNCCRDSEKKCSPQCAERQLATISKPCKNNSKD